jgi:hypothetical protein
MRRIRVDATLGARSAAPALQIWTNVTMVLAERIY